MRSFTKTLILSGTGIIFISFIVVYVLFNISINAYIRSESERELTRMSTSFVEIRGITGIQMRQITVDSHAQWEWTALDDEQHSISFHIDNPNGHVPVLNVPHIDVPNLPFWRSMFEVDFIVLDEHGEIISPDVNSLPDGLYAQVRYLTDYYLTHPEQFTVNETVRSIGGADNLFVRVTPFTVQNAQGSMLMYVDVSSAQAFLDNVNSRLLILLIASGLLSLGVSVLMSARFKTAVSRLCSRAQSIGHGHFDQKAGAFQYSEFNQLSESMDTMAHMLQAYELSQKQFFQNVSHELRTPLMSIQGYAEGILEDVFSKDEAAQIILTEGEKMANLVSGLLYLSRMDTGAPESISHINVKNLLCDCRELVKPIAAKSGKEIEITAQEGVTIDADESKLERAIINILTNSIRHATEKIQITLEADDKEITISIADDGEGIAEKDFPHIFERFYKGDNGNSGLGLAISNDIVKSLNGQLTAQNLPQGGALFVITLPTVY